MNFRNIALVAALATVAGVNAQAFELRAGAGATLNGNTFVVAPGSQFSVELWLNPAAGGTSAGNSLVVSLAYDRTNGTTASVNAPLDNKLTANPTGSATVGTVTTNSLPTFSSFATSTWASPIAAGMTTGRPGGNPSSTSQWNPATAGSARPHVWYVSRTGGSGMITSSVLLATFTFTANIANGDTYGDAANEAGLQVYNGLASTATSVTGGNSGLSGVGGFGSSKYAVQAVPEPGTIAALGLGLAAIARRRRNKK